MRQESEKARELRAAIERLPLSTRKAMLEGIETKPIVVGGDGDPRGGACPLYATASPPPKRIGRRFARAWDRYAGAWVPRPASERELRTLVAMLEASVERESQPTVSLGAAIASHKVSQARSKAAARDLSPPRRDSGERDRTSELERREGWAWARPFRRYDEYERALQTLEAMAGEAAFETEHERVLPA